MIPPCNGTQSRRATRNLGWLIFPMVMVGADLRGLAVPAAPATPVFEDRLVLFAGGRDPFGRTTIYPMPYRGGTASSLENGPPTMTVTTTKDGGGGGWRIAQREWPVLDRFASDPLATVGVVCGWPTDKAPGGVRVVFQNENNEFFTSSIARDSEPVDGGKWHRFRIPLSSLGIKGGKLTAQGVYVSTEKPTELVLKEVALYRTRNVQLDRYCEPGQVWKQLVVRGKTDKGVAQARVVIRPKDGKEQARVVAVKDGAFECVWDNPPVSAGRTNEVSAVVREGKDPADRSVPIVVDGTRGDNEHLWLRVKGKHLVTSPRAKGGERVFIPVGIGYARNSIISADDEAVARYAKDHHLNTIRHSTIYTRYHEQTGERIDMDKQITEHIEPVIAAAKRHGLYVILDDHEYFSGRIDEGRARTEQKVGFWNEAAIREWIDAWVKLATKYKDEPYVLGYELQNEPHDQPAAKIRENYTRCLKAIRKVDTRHIVLMGTWDWSHSRALEETWGPTAKLVDAPYNNVVFAFHDYPGDNQPWLVKGYVTSFRNQFNVPVMCTEFGSAYWAHSELECRKFQAGMLGLFAQEGIGWMIWALGGFTDDPFGVKGGVYPLDSCAYTDLWPPIARIMGSPLPERK